MVAPTPPITLQISLAPSDYRLAELLLPHQIAAWQGQVDEVLLTIDARRSRGRFGENWTAGPTRIMDLAARIPGARIIEVDYTPSARAAVSQMFFGGAAVPIKDYRGGPYYAYFFGLYSAKHDWVLHVDADMFFGGASATWLKEAIDLHQTQPDVLFSAPLSGPPSPDGTLRQLNGQPRFLDGIPAFAYPGVSTRLFFFNRATLRAQLGPIQPRRPPLRARLLALLDGNPAQMLPEDLISEAMVRRGLSRVDFLGRTPGRWSLHPPYRCTDFYAKLPSLVARVESGDLPEAQLGDHDINDSLVDWSEARARLVHRRWWRRLGERLLNRSL